MFRKLENTRLKLKSSKGSRAIAAAVIGTGILAGTAMTVNSAPQFTHFVGAVPQPGAFADLQSISWRGRDRAAMFRNLTEDQIEERLGRMVRHIGVEVDATPEQEAEILAILTPVALEMKGMVAQIGAPANVSDLLLANTIDRNAIEAMRAERLAIADEASKKMVGAVIDIAAVLSPDQRAILAERIDDIRAMRARWR